MTKSHGNFFFPLTIERDGDFLVLSFRDVPEALGQIAVTDEDDLSKAARDTLMIALKYYFKYGQWIPDGSAPEKGEQLIELPLSFVAKIILHNSMISHGVRPAELARRMGISTAEIARITNPNYKTKIDTLAAAVRAAGGTIRLTV